MPNIKSAKKRVDVANRNRMANKSNRSAMNTQIKKFNQAVNNNDVALAEKLLPETFAAIDATESKGTIHKNAANRRKAVAASKLASMKK